MMTRRWLNLGSGHDYRESQGDLVWVNADICPRVKADLYFDAFELPWPFDGGSFVGVLAYDFLEHVPHTVFATDGSRIREDGFVAVMNELHRVLVPSGLLEARFPVAGGPTALIDPTHTRQLFEETFLWYFTQHGPYQYYTAKHWRLLRFETFPAEFNSVATLERL